MKKVFWMMALMASMTITANAENLVEASDNLEPLSDADVALLNSMEATQQKATIEVPAWVNNIKFSGYGMLQYQAEDKDNAHSNTFNLRLARFILDGKIGDFDWRAQI